MNKVEWLDHINRGIARGPYSASMKSLSGYRAPAWYREGKFGIFIHWGVYSVPAYGNEWYPRLMYQPGRAEFDHHIKTYGPHNRFGYKDFIPMLTAERFDPDDWAELFLSSGAKFVVPVAEHHDGFQMYRSGLSRWNAYEMGPKRDILGELAQSIRRKGLVFGASSHRAEHYWFMDGVHKCHSDYAPDLEDFYGPAEPAPEDTHSTVQNPPTADHLDDWLIRTCELVERYRPQLLWFDWWINHMAFRPYLEKFAAYYYNRGAEWNLGVAINHKYSAYDKGCAVFDVERGQLPETADTLWQNDTSVSKNSWGYIEGHDYKKPADLLCDLADIVSKNGALLLNIGPRPDGTIPGPERDILQAIGAWLRANGEAIYGTRPWRVYGEGPTRIPGGAFTDTERDAFTGADIRYTARGRALYALVLGRPAENRIVCASVKPDDGYTAAFAMDGTQLGCEARGDGLHVTLAPGMADGALPLVVRLA